MTTNPAHDPAEQILESLAHRSRASLALEVALLRIARDAFIETTETFVGAVLADAGDAPLTPSADAVVYLARSMRAYVEHDAHRIADALAGRRTA